MATLAWIPFSRNFRLRCHKVNALLQGHGEDDLIIKLEWARRAAEVLRPRSESLDFKTYKDVGHMISDMQVNDKKGRIRSGYGRELVNYTLAPSKVLPLLASVRKSLANLRKNAPTRKLANDKKVRNYSLALKP